jgi:hypothetical protein
MDSLFSLNSGKITGNKINAKLTAMVLRVIPVIIRALKKGVIVNATTNRGVPMHIAKIRR